MFIELENRINNVKTEHDERFQHIENIVTEHGERLQNIENIVTKMEIDHGEKIQVLLF